MCSWHMALSQTHTHTYAHAHAGGNERTRRWPAAPVAIDADVSAALRALLGTLCVCGVMHACARVRER